MSDILERLQRVADHSMPETDIVSTSDCINQLRNIGWQPDEIFNYLRWSEEVTELVSEKNCLARMAKVRQAVNERLNRDEP